MKESFKNQILKYLRHSDYRPVKLQKLARELGVSSDDYHHFKAAFDELRGAGLVAIRERSLIELRPLTGQVVGTFRANPKGFGFVTALEKDQHADLFIPPDSTADAVTGDIVSARVVRQTRRGGQIRYSGKIVEVLQRGQNKIVGTLRKGHQGWFVEPDGRAFVEPVSVDDVTAKNAHEKDKVVAEIITWPTEKYLARGVIVEVLGKAGRYESEINSIIRQYQLPELFDEDCLSQARLTAEMFEKNDSADREDITDKTIITIDPPDAKDFDDAISLEKDSEGKWVLGVHIADVSYFVPEGSPLDNQAKERGNSVYLPGKTLPMLPEILSNGICSLQPGQKRFVKSAYTTYDQQGKILSRRFANSSLCSTQRLTYEQADNALRGKTRDILPEVVKLLKDMEQLSRIIEKRRTKEGMLHLDLPETELVFDKAGRVIDAHPADTSYPHTIIEMFMVEANEAVAGLLDRLNVSFIRRIHPEPDVMSLKELSNLLRTVGLSFPKNPDRYDIQQLLESVKGKPSSPTVNMVVLRSLERAVYSPRNIGHYALASRHYSHFTSPIRRYADLLVHRLLENHLQKKSAPKDEDTDLVEIGKHITFTEERAEDAEKELKTVLILQMLSKKIGDVLDCVVTGLAGFGVFAQCNKFGIEGLIPLEQLGRDDWQYNQKGYCITGRHSGKVIHLGQPIKARIISVDVSSRRLSLAPAEPITEISQKQGKEKKERKQRKIKRTGRFK
jgi:ribonuclease R